MKNSTSKKSLMRSKATSCERGKTGHPKQLVPQIAKTLPKVFFSSRLESLAALIRDKAPRGVVNAVAMQFATDAVHDTLRLNGVHAPSLTDEEMQPGFMAFGIGENL